MVKDAFANQGSSLTSPFTHAEPVVPSDAVDLPYASRALYVGSQGDVRVTTLGGTIVTFRDHPAGYMPARVARVHATGTSATDIVALW
ncbi:MAG TPA: hypothetical protein VFR34_16175 [Paracoccaceae bacterium]|nr:hypothetical protein [Paracoccaceae bacterium]